MSDLDRFKMDYLITLRKFIGGSILFCVGLTIALIICINVGWADEVAWKYVLLPGFLLFMISEGLAWLVLLGRTAKDGEPFDQVSKETVLRNELDQKIKDINDNRYHPYWLLNENKILIFRISDQHNVECAAYSIIKKKGNKFWISEDLYDLRGTKSMELRPDIDIIEEISENKGDIPTKYLEDFLECLEGEIDVSKVRKIALKQIYFEKERS